MEVEQLNADCRCVTLDRARLAAAVETAVGDPAFANELVASRPNLVSGQPVFLSRGHSDQITAAVAAIERVASNENYRRAVMLDAPHVAHCDWGPRGVFMGYDFHLGADGPRLIEINTNAGGALINAYVREAHRSCCTGMSGLFEGGRSVRDFETMLVAMFAAEHQRQITARGGAPRVIAIVDHDPPSQYLYPEFVLFKRMFERYGIACEIAAPDVLELRNGRLVANGADVDLVYNRSTDFMLAEPESRVLRQAYATGNVVLTPNPHNHALLANKANLALLSDAPLLRSWGVSESDIGIVTSAIPKTFIVRSGHADSLWPDRARYFFKPLAGFGSKGTYRGDKITKRVWGEIIAGGYVAQELVPPSNRAVRVDDRVEELKLDLRAFTYEGTVQLLAARLYQGQTTNFRTPGGGFAPVFVGDDAVRECGCG